LLVEVCYNNASWTAYSTVNATSATGKMVGYCTDLPSGDGCTAAWTATSFAYRCNTSFKFNTLTGIGNNLNLIPTVFSLSQNYPNPFNPITKINYSIPKTNFVTIKVFDVLGREILTLVNDVKQPGYYTIDFDGSNIASGVYFYKMESGAFTDVKKFMLIK
jgi:hypothetical protein